MECTPEEIAEKKRIALERLKAKKEAIAKSKASSAPQPNPKDPLSTSTKVPTNPYQNARSLSHPYANRMPSSNNVNVKKQQTAPIPSKVISCTCYMISHNRFEVQPSAFSSPLINAFKTIPSRNYGTENDRGSSATIIAKF